MDVVHPRCCGLDVHKRLVVACVLISGTPGRPRREVRTFGTLTDELRALADWLAAEGVTHVAREATGSYWKPIWNLLEGSFDLLLANAQHIKAVPGRKTDVQDAEWIAALLRHGEEVRQRAADARREAAARNAAQTPPGPAVTNPPPQQPATPPPSVDYSPAVYPAAYPAVVYASYPAYSYYYPAVSYSYRSCYYPRSYFSYSFYPRTSFHVGFRPWSSLSVGFRGGHFQGHAGFRHCR